MGRNAEKRKAKKAPPPPTPIAGAAPAQQVVEQEDEIVAPGPRSLAGQIDIPSHVDADGSLARALFKVTCLLAVRDHRGVPPENMQKVAAEVAQIVEADTVSLLKLEHGDDVVPSRLVLVGAFGLAPVDEGLVTFELGDGVAGKVALSGEVMRIEDAPRDPRFSRLYGQRTEIGSLLCLPLRYGGRVFGVVTASRREIRAFSPADEERLAVVASSIAQDMEQTRLLFDAVTDPLTGLGSRLSLLIALPREVEVARRYRTDLSLVVLDLDGLAAVNEKHGKLAGDRVLIESGRRLRGALRAADLAVRLGGDEFAALLPMTSSNNARALAKRLLKTMAQPVVGEDALKWSLGVSTLAADEDALGLLWRADMAVDDAKREGGDRFHAAPMPRRVLE
jgi:diguanylate cyclase (GGDEF)-like protein